VELPPGPGGGVGAPRARDGHPSRQALYWSRHAGVMSAVLSVAQAETSPRTPASNAVASRTPMGASAYPARRTWNSQLGAPFIMHWVSVTCTGCFSSLPMPRMKPMPTPHSWRLDL